MPQPCHSALYVHVMPSEQSATSTHDWRPRLVALANARTRYFYVLGAAGVIYFALRTDLASIAELSGFTVPAAVILATGPLVIAFLIQAVTGAMIAIENAAWRMAVVEEVELERQHTSPSAIDMAFYTTGQSTSLARAARQLVYPIYLSVFFFESCWLVYQSDIQELGNKIISLSSSLTINNVLTGIGILFIISALPRLVGLWRRKLACAGKIW